MTLESRKECLIIANAYIEKKGNSTVNIIKKPKTDTAKAELHRSPIHW